MQITLSRRIAEIGIGALLGASIVFVGVREDRNAARVATNAEAIQAMRDEVCKMMIVGQLPNDQEFFKKNCNNH